MDESASDERVAAFAVEHRELSEKLALLTEAIGGMDGAARLRPAEAALLQKYEHNRARIEVEIGAIESQLRELDRRSANDVIIAVIPDEVMKLVE